MRRAGKNSDVNINNYSHTQPNLQTNIFFSKFCSYDFSRGGPRNSWPDKA